ncbi:MAG: NAD-binding protein [Candidatus Diapherotrites archaeon]|nr:NAD-binding protein [Candidatus Diapherotrites archaeon]
MYVIVVGAGNLGYYLTQLLLEEGHDVVVIDKDPKACERISNELNVVATQGDATESKTLEKANVKECDALVALAGNDETNLVVSLIAKELGAKQVATRLGKVDYNERVLNKLGVDIVIHPEAAAAGYIEELITKPEVLDLAFISRGAAEIMEVEITEKSKIAHKKVSEIEHPSGSAIIAIYEGEKLIIPSTDTIIKPGTKVLILAKREIADKVRSLIA